MTKKYLIKLGAPILALSLIAACGNADEQDPIEEDLEQEAPMDEEAPLEDPAEEIQEEAPFNDDAGTENDDAGMGNEENEGDIDPALNDDEENQ